MTLPGQLDLLDWTPRARRSDPQTSHEAANSVDKFAGEHFKLILDALRASPVPLAAEQIADATGSLDYVAVGKRTSELLDAGLIVRTDERHTNRSGRSAFKYRVVA